MLLSSKKLNFVAVFRKLLTFFGLLFLFFIFDAAHADAAQAAFRYQTGYSKDTRMEIILPDNDVGTVQEQTGSLADGACTWSTNWSATVYG
jgi:hypothetical protein